jgi:4-hydroxyproline epimerase
MQFIRVIDTHTAGEPTRIVVEGVPDLGKGSMAERRLRFHTEFDHFRSALILEPRGSEVWVGALLTPPAEPDCFAGVIFFNNAGVLNMCGHGAMGVAVALFHERRIKAGPLRLDTPVGVVEIDFDGHHSVTIENVPSYRLATDVTVNVQDYGPVTGDIAWGGNWFYLCHADDHRLVLDNVASLTHFTTNIRRALVAEGLTGVGGAEIDHIELSGPPFDPANNCRNFVLCPGYAYDRSPCGTGTSAKLACLFADGHLQPGQVWRQEGILGTVFQGSFRVRHERIIPRIGGSAFVIAESKLVLDPSDPFRWGIRQ